MSSFAKIQTMKRKKRRMTKPSRFGIFTVGNDLAFRTSLSLTGTEGICL